MTEPSKLIADIGGTNARFALCSGQHIHDEITLRCAEYPTLQHAITHYLGQVGPSANVTQAALAIAAPISGDVVNMTNHHWRFSVSALRHALNFSRLIVVNDFTALAMAIRHLPAHELQQVGGQRNHDPDKPIAILGAGTGLGVSGLIPYDQHWIPLQGEGGHVSLAPGNVREAAILQTLWHTFDHVSAERALSGNGLENLYRAICTLDGVTSDAISAADITAHALNGNPSQCVEALETFCALLGSVAGNLVLTLGATQAVYIGGGIVPRFADYFARSSFRARFEGKGRYVDYLCPVPVYVIHTEKPAFLGLTFAFAEPGPRVECVA